MSKKQKKTLEEFSQQFEGFLGSEDKKVMHNTGADLTRILHKVGVNHAEYLL